MIFFKKNSIINMLDVAGKDSCFFPIFKKDKKGQVFLSMALLIGGIIVAVGIFFSFFVSSFIDSGYGLQSSYIAEAAATSGVEDALLQLERNGSFSNTSGYVINVGRYSATVTVSTPTPAGIITIYSVSTVLSRTKRISVKVSENPINNQIMVVSWQEI